jgi:chromosome segregation ATPase
MSAAKLLIEFSLRSIGFITLPVEKIVLSIMGLKIEIGDGTKSIDDRIAKIEIARTNLEEALEAIDDLRRTADKNKIQLDQAMAKLASIEDKKSLVAGELESLARIRDADVGAFRRIMGVQTDFDKWKERAIGFITGIIGSILASILWHFVTKYYGLS